MQSEDFRPSFSAKHRVLLLTAGKGLDKEVYWRGYDLIARFIAAHGPCSVIFDLSALTAFNLPYDFLREIAAKPSPVPPGMRRLIVAPHPAAYGSSRIIETLRSDTAAPVGVLHSLDEAFAAVGAAAADFIALDLS